MIVDVNELNAHPTGTCDVTPCEPTASVSAEVSSESSDLVVERQMFFHYQLSNVATPQKSVNTAGWTDVVGLIAPAINQASFAEGYVNINYNEWLVLQNPTNASEDVTLYLYNELGNTYHEDVTLPAHRGESLRDLNDGAREYRGNRLCR